MTKILLAVVVGVLASALVSTIAVAQNAEEVTVTASRIVAKTVGHAATGAPINDITLTYGVSYTGLDLSSSAGAEALEKRVNAAAQQACNEIGRQYPHSTPDDWECAKATSAKAMVKAHELIIAAGQKPAK